MSPVSGTLKNWIRYVREPTTSNRVTWIARAVVALLAAALTFSFISFVSSLDPTTDLTIYFMAAEAVHKGKNPYSFAVETTYPGTGTVQWGYLYPPLLASIFSPLVPFGFSVVHLCWALVTTGAMLLTAWVLYAGRRAEGKGIGLGWLLIAISFWPIAIDGFERGQINAIVLGVLALILYGLRCNRHGFVGLGIALAVQVKVMPIIFMVLLLDRTMKNARTAFLFGSLVVISGIAFWVGVEIWQQFMTSALSTAAGGSAWISPENLAISHLLCLVFPALDISTALWLQRGVVALGVGSVARCILRNGGYDKEQIFCRLTVLMFLASPIVWYHHAVWLIFPIVWCWRNRRHFSERFLLVSVTLCMTGYRYSELAICTHVGWSPDILIVEPLVFAVSLLALWMLMRSEVGPKTQNVYGCT